MRNIYNEAEYINEDEGIFTVGDDILSSFYYGNFTQGIKEMIENYVEPEELAEYLEEKAEEYGYESVNDLYNGHFTLSYFAAIGQAYQQKRNEEINHD